MFRSAGLSERGADTLENFHVTVRDNDQIVTSDFL
jgi:hypothetical protein